MRPSIANIGCRAESSPLEIAEHVVGQWCVEVRGDCDPSGVQSQYTISRAREGHQPGNGFSGFGDDDFISSGRAIQEAGQMGLSFVDIDHPRILHEYIVD
jgi:hypothetical protein